jgi:hypothetical protein
LANTRTHIVKRSPNYTEPYDERKLYASVYAACLCVRTPAGEAELTAERVCLEVAPWVASKAEVTSKDIRHKAAIALKIYNPDAAYMYERHRILA